MIRQRQWCVCNMITRQKRPLRWMAKCKLCIQGRIGQAWSFGTANIQKIKSLHPNCLTKSHQNFYIDNEIGSLPLEYNWLVGWYKEPNDGSPKILHYTEGGPWFDGYRDCEYADDWKKELINLFSA